MIELWTKAQINELLTPERLQAIHEAVAQSPTTYSNERVEISDGSKPIIIESKETPPSGLRVVVYLDGLTAAITYNEVSGTTVEQVVRKTRTVTVVEYVNVRDA